MSVAKSNDKPVVTSRPNKGSPEIPQFFNDKTTEVCECERNIAELRGDSTEIDRVRCFVKHYAALQRRRGCPLDVGQLRELEETKSLNALRIAEFTCRDTSEELALSLILFSFLESYCKRHPRFALDVPFGSAFKGKINFFQSI